MYQVNSKLQLMMVKRITWGLISHLYQIMISEKPGGWSILLTTLLRMMWFKIFYLLVKRRKGGAEACQSGIGREIEDRRFITHFHGKLIP